MTQRAAIPCPECDREKYFEGLCYSCKNRKLREYYESMSRGQILETVENIIAKIDGKKSIKISLDYWLIRILIQVKLLTQHFKKRSFIRQPYIEMHQMKSKIN